MSDQFVVPEPSEAAIDASSRKLMARDGLRAAYAVDVPAIVRAEVERALRKRQEDPLNFGIAAYLAARFGEGEPEQWSTKHEHQWTTLGGGNPAVVCGACGAFKDAAPSAPAETGATHAFMLFDGSREPGCLYTPAERDFLRALAAERAALDDVMPARLSGIQFCGHITEERREGAAREYKARQETVAAARRVVEEAR